MSNESQTSSWTSLSTFSITSDSGGNRLYANGRQQIKLRIAVRAVDNGGKWVRLSQSELNSITLIEAYGENPVPQHEASGTSPLAPAHIEWAWGRRNNPLFQYHSGPEGQTPLPENPEPNTQYVFLYVRTTARTSNDFSIMIKHRDGDEYTSPDKNNGIIRLTPVVPPLYTKHNYHFERTNFFSFPLPRNSTAYAYHRLSLQAPPPHFEFIDLRFESENGLVIYRAPIPLHANTVGLAIGADVNYGSRSHRSFHNRVRSEYIRKGQAILVTQAVQDNAIIRTWYGGRTIAFPSTSIIALDNQGNNHLVGIRFTSGYPPSGDLELF